MAILKKNFACCKFLTWRLKLDFHSKIFLHLSHRCFRPCFALIWHFRPFAVAEIWSHFLQGNETILPQLFWWFLRELLRAYFLEHKLHSYSFRPLCVLLCWRSTPMYLNALGHTSHLCSQFFAMCFAIICNLRFLYPGVLDQTGGNNIFF